MATPPRSAAVIVPVRNGAVFVDQALASVAAQTVPADEVIVVDDGSEDDSYQRVQRWADILPLNAIRLPARSGTWNARHTAITAAGTDLIVQLDADDILMPQHIAAMTQAYETSPGLIAPSRLLWEDSGRAVPKPINEILPAPEDQLGHILVLNYLGIGATFSKATYHSVGGYRQCSYAEDWDLWMRFAAAGVPVVRAEERTYVYRMHPTNISSNVNRRVTDLEIIEKFLGDCHDPAYRRIAKLSLLQRRGQSYLATLDAVDPEALGFDCTIFGFTGPLQVTADPDLGHVVVGQSVTGNRQLAVVAPEGLVLRADFNEDHRPRVRETGRGLLGLSYWPYPA